MLILAGQSGSTVASQGILDQASKVKTPIGLAALSFVILFLLYRQIVSRSEGLSSKGTERIVRSIFILAMVAMFLGFGGYIAHSLLSNDPYIRIYGRVTTAQNSSIGVPNAIVHMQLDTITDVYAMTEGDFAITLPRSFIGRTAQVWATADGYQESPVDRVLISPIANSLNLPMTHMADTGQLAGNPSCVTGAWLEQPSGGFVWQINVTSNTLHLRRGDDWAQGDFHLQGSMWIGSLHWGNGTTWPDVTLSPDQTCSKISTNKDWWYQRH